MRRVRQDASPRGLAIPMGRTALTHPPTHILTSAPRWPQTTPFAPPLPTSLKLSASSASAGPIRTWQNVGRRPSAMANQHSAPAASSAISLTARANPSVSTSSFPKGVTASVMAHAISVQDVVLTSTVPPDALAERRTRPITPLIYSGWLAAMLKHDLVNKYPNVLSTIQNTMVIGVPLIKHTFIPPNKSSIAQYASQFRTIIEYEYSTHRHLGPFIRRQLEVAIGQFQTSPLSIIPKPGKPGKFWLMQDFSFPHAPSSSISSINTVIDSSLYPCTWGTFSTMALCISRLPPGSQAAARDKAEAYRTILLHPSQWNGTVVRISEESFNLDTCLSFGLTPSAGIYGICADAANDIMQAEGIGPIIKWVDDRVFFRISQGALADFNAVRAQLHTQIMQNGAMHHEGGRMWYHAGHLSDGRVIECDEDMAFPLKDLSASSPRSSHNAKFTYGMHDIDRIAAGLGIPWERSKDIPFGTVVCYIGLD